MADTDTGISILSLIATVFRAQWLCDEYSSPIFCCYFRHSGVWRWRRSLAAVSALCACVCIIQRSVHAWMNFPLENVRVSLVSLLFDVVVVVDVSPAAANWRTQHKSGSHIKSNWLNRNQNRINYDEISRFVREILREREYYVTHARPMDFFLFLSFFSSRLSVLRVALVLSK